MCVCVSVITFIQITWDSKYWSLIIQKFSYSKSILVLFHMVAISLLNLSTSLLYY